MTPPNVPAPAPPTELRIAWCPRCHRVADVEQPGHATMTCRKCGPWLAVEILTYKRIVPDSGAVFLGAALGGFVAGLVRPPSEPPRPTVRRALPRRSK